MTIENVLDGIKAIYNNNGGYIGESRYKQSIFEKFFRVLGYINDYSRGIAEIHFEVPDRNNGFIDIAVGNDIIVEVKGSDESVNNSKFIDQAFRYNSSVGKRLVVVTNFKRMKIFEVGRNNLLADLDLLNYNDQTIRDLYYYFHPYCFKEFDDFDNFFWNYFVDFEGSHFELLSLINDKINRRNIYFSEFEIGYFRNFFKKAIYLISFLESNIKFCVLRDELIFYKEKLRDLRNRLEYNIYTEYNNYSINVRYLDDVKSLLMEINDSKKYLDWLIRTNILAYNLDAEYYIDYPNEYDFR